MNQENLQQLIESWNGNNAILFEYKISLGFLRIVITSKSNPHCLDIQCLDTEYIRGKTRWKSCCLKVKEVNVKTESGIPIKFMIKDETAGFEVHCGMISIEEAAADFNDLVNIFGNSENKNES